MGVKDEQKCFSIGGLPKKGEGGSLDRFKKGLAKKEGVFWGGGGGGDTPMHTMKAQKVH